MRVAQYNSATIAGYTVDAIENTVTVSDDTGIHNSVIDFTLKEFQMQINTLGWKDKCMLLIPRIGMKHGNNNLILDTGHWGPTEYPVIIKNTQSSTIKIFHNTEDGIIRYG